MFKPTHANPLIVIAESRKHVANFCEKQGISASVVVPICDPSDLEKVVNLKIRAEQIEVISLPSDGALQIYEFFKIGTKRGH